MKRIYILSVFIFLVNILQAQDVPEVQQSLITKITATWCPNCGTWGWSFYENLATDNDDKALMIKAHYSGSLQNAIGQNLTSNFNASYQPEFFVGNMGQPVNSGNTATMRASISAAVDAKYLEAPMVNAGVNVERSGNNLIINVKTKFFQTTYGEYYTNVYIVEDDVIASQSGLSSSASHQDIIRTAAHSSTFGTQVANGSISSGMEVTNSYTVPINSAWDLDKLEFMAIVWSKSGNTYNFENGSSTTCVCSRVTNYSATPQSATSTFIDWDDVPEASFYQVKYRLKGTSAWLTTGVANSQRVLNNLTPNKNYQYKIRAQCSDNCWSDFSPIEVFYTSTCDVPTGVASVYLDENRMRVRWDTNSDYAKNRVRYRAVGTSTWLAKNSAPDKNFVYITGLAPGTTYEYRVRGHCNNGEWSNYTDKYYHTTALLEGRLSSMEAVEKLKVFPNPTIDVLNLSFETNDAIDVRIVITDILGKTIQSQTNSYNKGQQMVQLDVVNLSQGYYFLTLYNGDNISTVKFAKH